MKILCLDSSKVTGRILSDQLTRNNYEVTYINNGEEGLLRFNEISYDLVFMNLELPNINGYFLSKEFKKVAKEVPVIVYSSHNKKEIDMDSFDDYLKKPFEKEDLEEILVKYLF